MSHKSRTAIIFLLLALVGAGTLGVLAGPKLAAIPAVLLLLAWLVVDRLIYAPAAILAREAAYLAQTKGSARAPVYPNTHLLGEMVPAIRKLSDTVMSSRTAFEAELENATKQSEEQRRWLEVILVDLSEGVLVCNLNHQLLLYNQTATRLFDTPEAVGLGRPLFALVSEAPVRHTLELLEHKRRSESPGAAETLPFLCATADGQRILDGRMGLILDSAGKTSAYVLTFSDMSGRIEELANASLVRQAFTRDLRGPIANLRLAAEALDKHTDMKAEMRQALEKVVASETLTISDKVEQLASIYRGHALGRWPMAEMNGADLIACLERRLKPVGGPSVTLIGLPEWVHADHYLLLLLLMHLAKKLSQRFGLSEIDIETRPVGQRVFLDLIWKGGTLPDSEIKSWFDEPLPGTELTVRDALERHGSDLWCQLGADQRPLLRLPLPVPAEASIKKRIASHAPARPEFYDFGLLAQHADIGDLAERSLRSITFVVFDTETTGLRPSQGDEIVQMGAVRVVNGRLLTGEIFERLVNPGRKIPEESIKFHHITDDMVKDKPPIGIVLPQFKSFVGDAVLVAHNAAFDLKFLHMKEQATGVRFTNPVVDTLLLSRLADQHFDDHSLDGIANRFNIEIPERHSALGDALATAVVLVRLIEVLEAQGIRTLGQVMRLTNMAAQVRANQQHF